jgi:acyl-CoA thioester hydrolase
MMTKPDAEPTSGWFDAGAHVLPLRVYYEDTDFSGVVYHAGYLRFMERGRTDYLRLLGIDHRAMFEATQQDGPGFAFVVRSMQIEFIKPARMDDVLEVWTAPQDVKGASATLLQHVVRDGETLIEASVRFACVAGGKPQRIPEPLRRALEADRAALVAALSTPGAD